MLLTNKPTNKQTNKTRNKQTNKPYQKHNLLGGSKNAFVSSFHTIHHQFVINELNKMLSESFPTLGLII